MVCATRLTLDDRPIYRALRGFLAYIGWVLILLLPLVLTVPSSVGEETDSSEAASALQGDIDGSGRIDETDKSLMEKALGANSSDPDWDPRCDLDGDGLVSFNDFAILMASMGEALSGLNSGSSSCGRPKLIFAPRIPMRELPLNGAYRGETKLEFRIGRDGNVNSVKVILSSLEPDARDVLLFYARGWYFETATNASMDNKDSYSIISARCQDIIELEEGPLPR